MKVIKLVDTVYKTDVWVVGDCTLIEFEKYVRRLFPDYEAPGEDRLSGVITSCLRNGDSYGRFVWVYKLSKKTEPLGVLVHELLHMAIRILEDKGIPTSSKATAFEGACYWNADEPCAYLLEGMLVQVLEKLR